MKIVITGGPGTGKSEVAKVLSNLLRLPLISLTDIVNKNNLYETDDKGEKEVDTGRLQKFMGRNLMGKNDFVVEGHLACEIALPADYIFVLRCHPDVLRKRMKERGYSKEKIEENLEAEMLDYCTQKAEKVSGRTIEIDTTKISAVKAAEKIARIIKYNLKVGDSVDYSGELKKKLRLK